MNPVGAPCDAANGPSLCQQRAFQLPPRTKAARTYPKLVNYYHRMDRAEAQVANREDYLAQWDVIIVNPQNAKDQGLDLARIRAVNPGIKILAWIPFGQSSLDFEMSTGMPVTPAAPNGISDYFLTTAGGTVIQWAWGGYLMNPYKNDFAFADQVVDYLEAHYLGAGGYDGIMFDCLWSIAPTFLSTDSPQTVDVNGDGKYDSADDTAYLAGVMHLLTRLRADRVRRDHHRQHRLSSRSRLADVRQDRRGHARERLRRRGRVWGKPDPRRRFRAHMASVTRPPGTWGCGESYEYG